MMSESLCDWQVVLDKLCSSETRLRLGNKLDNKGRIKKCFSNKFIYDTLYQWLTAHSQLSNWKKNKEKAAEFRSKGNNFYMKGDVHQSLPYYTRAVLLAPKDSEELQLAFGNRSAALFSLKKYQECISDIKYALSNNKIPSSRDVRLVIRKAKALESLKKFSEGLEAYEVANSKINRCSDLDQKKLHQLKDEIQQGLNKLKQVKKPQTEANSETIEDEFKFIMGSFISETEFPSASSKLTLLENSCKGRHVVAGEDLSIGEVIFLEKPFTFVVLPDYSFDHCQACCKEIINPLPCKHCAEACFCSKECRRIAWNKFHKWECGFGLNLSYKIGIAHLGFRVALTGFCNPDNPEYQRVKNLKQHIHSLEAEDLYQYSLTATVLVVYLEKFTNILIGPNRIDSLLEIGGSILLHIAQMVCNGHAITAIMLADVKYEDKILNEEQVRVATAIYPSASMMNHSCDPSIINSFKDEYLIVRTIKNIKKGEEVYNCYGPHFRRMTRQERRSSLLQQYMFLCQCEQCTSGEDFIERFTAYRCQNKTCDGLISVYGRSCPKCLISLSEDCVIFVDKAKAFMCAAQEAASDKNFQKSIHLAEKALKLYSKYLYKHHKEIMECKDFLAKILIQLGRNYKSYKYIEETIIGNKERFGKNSIEVANEIIKLCDIALTILEVYLEGKDTIKITEAFTDIFSHILEYIEEAQEIFRLCYGKMYRKFQELEDHKKAFKTFICDYS